MRETLTEKEFLVSELYTNYTELTQLCIELVGKATNTEKSIDKISKWFVSALTLASTLIHDRVKKGKVETLNDTDQQSFIEGMNFILEDSKYPMQRSIKGIFDLNSAMDKDIESYFGSEDILKKIEMLRITSYKVATSSFAIAHMETEKWDVSDVTNYLLALHSYVELSKDYIEIKKP